MPPATDEMLDPDSAEETSGGAWPSWTILALIVVTLAAGVVFVVWGLAASADPSGGCGGG